MYEMSDRPPKAGSLKESLFLTVWLRRQEIDVARWRVIAQGFANREAVGDAFKDLIAAVFPFQKDMRRASDKRLVEQMQKEIAKGPIAFSPIVVNPFKDKVKRMSMPDETLQKLRAAAKKGKG